MHGIPLNLESGGGDTRYHCGKLVYTKAGLFTLFTWLLWGDFCFSLMETIWPNVLPLMLNGQHASNLTMGLVITTIPAIMNLVLNPIISMASDRHRGPRGRRIPFLLATTPCLVLFLLLLGWSRELGAGLHRALAASFPHLSAAGVTIAVICVLLICFRFFELFVNTVFWYLFNDVVPSAFMGRFLGFFRIVGGLAGGLFNFFVFKYAESHTSAIFFGVALLYGTVFMLMCLKVKEGSYPAPEAIRKRSPVAYFRAFFEECYSHRIFRLTFVYTLVSFLVTAISTFSVFMAFSIGLTLDQVGKVAGIAGFVSVALMYPVGWMIDRYHPIRVALGAQAVGGLIAAGQLVFLFHEFPKETVFWVYAVLAGSAIAVNIAIVGVSLPLVMRIFPHDRFGQFCAANAQSSAVGWIVGGSLAGAFLDLMKRFFPQADYYYRFVPVWTICFAALSVGAMALVYREWQKLGGDQGYQPPIRDKFTTFYQHNAGQTAPEV